MKEKGFLGHQRKNSCILLFDHWYFFLTVKWVEFPFQELAICYRHRLYFKTNILSHHIWRKSLHTRIRHDLFSVSSPSKSPLKTLGFNGVFAPIKLFQKITNPISHFPHFPFTLYEPTKKTKLKPSISQIKFFLLNQSHIANPSQVAPFQSLQLSNQNPCWIVPGRPNKQTKIQQQTQAKIGKPLCNSSLYK